MRDWLSSSVCGVRCRDAQSLLINYQDKLAALPNQKICAWQSIKSDCEHHGIGRRRQMKTTSLSFVRRRGMTRKALSGC